MNWIKVSDRLPGMGQRVLVCCKSQGIQICHLAFINNRESISFVLSTTLETAYLNITHWMPLPELPKD